MEPTADGSVAPIDLIGDLPTYDGPVSGRRATVETPRPFGAYQSRERIGGGGMGQIYSAVHMLLRREVAIKVLRPELVRNRTAVLRFFNEACVVNQIRHPNIIDVHDLVQETEGEQRIYYVMELLHGRPLSTVLREEVLSEARLICIAVQICSALQAVHRAGVVHRDLKPENVFLCPRPDGSELVKLLDFGISELRADSRIRVVAGDVPRTVSGTPAYMAPEVIRRQALDHRADLYALGVMLYEMLTSELPIHGEGARGLLDAQLHQLPAPPSAVATMQRSLLPELDAIVLRCLAKEPDLRPHSVSELALALDRAAARHLNHEPLHPSYEATQTPELDRRIDGRPTLRPRPPGPATDRPRGEDEATTRDMLPPSRLRSVPPQPRR